MDYPKVSIVTPTYNQGQFLENTIISVLNQNYPNLEYIIIDGGSTDKSVEIIKRHEKDISRWISEKDNGMYEAMNKGLRIASGDILAYLNSDDLYLPDTIKTVVDYFQRNPKIHLVYGDCDFIDSKGQFLFTYRYPEFRWRRYVAMNWSSIPQQASFWRRDIHKQLGYFDPEFEMCGDFDFYARVGRYFKIGHLKKPLAVYRLHKKSLSSTRQHKSDREMKIIHQRYCVPSGLVDIFLRFWGALQIKLLNWQLMIRKILKLQKVFL